MDVYGVCVFSVVAVDTCMLTLIHCVSSPSSSSSSSPSGTPGAGKALLAPFVPRMAPQSVNASHMNKSGTSVAMDVTLLPRGTVQFSTMEAEGIVAVVTKAIKGGGALGALRVVAPPTPLLTSECSSDPLGVVSPPSVASAASAASAGEGGSGSCAAEGKEGKKGVGGKGKREESADFEPKEMLLAPWHEGTGRGPNLNVRVYLRVYLPVYLRVYLRVLTCCVDKGEWG